MTFDVSWDARTGLAPAVIQDWRSGEVLMLGYMNAESLAATEFSGRVTFFSRSKQRLWVKGETSGHYLKVKTMALDCDADTLLILAEPEGPACHTGTRTCWGSTAPRPLALHSAFLAELEAVITRRLEERPAGSYTTRLLAGGPRRLAQKVGEEGVELALAAVAQNDAEVLGEAADLLFHVLVLLKSKGLSLGEVCEVLRSRHAAASC